MTSIRTTPGPRDHQPSWPGGTAWIAALTVGLAVAGCSKVDSKPATQVAAKVNKEEISVHQINFVLQRQPGLKPEQAEVAGRQVLERLIDQEVAMQKAQEQKLDRDPRVMQEIEAARREIIARAFVTKLGEAAAKPDADAIKAYYDKNPALFGQRRIYALQEVLVEAGPEQVTDLQSRLPTFKSLVQLGEYLREKKLPTRSSQNTTAAEGLPMHLLEQFAALKDGQTIFSPAPNGARLITLLQARSAPITLEQARPAIEQFLGNDLRRKAVEAELKTVRAAAQVEYVGQFAVKPAAAPASAAGTAAVDAAPAAAPAPASGLAGSSMEKGLAGLK